MNSKFAERPLVIILLGAPGSGKGTQAQRLAHQYNIPHISTGDIFREHIKNSTDIGKKVQGVIQAGQLVSDDLVLEMVQERLARNDCKKGLVLDGFPRTVTQAEKLFNFLDEQTLILVLCLEVEDQLIIERASKRLVCRQCNTIYSQEPPPVIDHICDKCQGEVMRRPDDVPEVVKSRLEVYHHQTQPLVKYFDEKKLLTAFEGHHSRDTVFQELINYIDQQVQLFSRVID